MQEVWSAALPKLLQRLGERNFHAWIGPLRCVDIPAPDALCLEAPNQFFCNWVTEYFLDEIRHVLAEEVGKPCTVEVLPPVNGKTAGPPQSRQAAARAKPSPSGQAAPPRAAQPRRRAPAAVRIGQLVDDYTFERFVVGPPNLTAYEAARAAAERPGRGFNPIFIHGSVGLGKTHLINAVGHELLARHRRARVACVPAETFANMMVHALRHRGMEGFRDRFRGLHALILDDVQFLAGKEGIQEEFFHTFEALFAARRQVVLTSDRPPAEIVRLEARLRSRFEGGLIVAVAPPTREMRVEITLRKGRERGIELPHEVVEMIADRCGPTVREIEGALSCLILRARGAGGKVSVELAREVLGSWGTPRRRITVEEVVAAVARDAGVSPRDLVSRQRERRFAEARQCAMYLSRELAGESLPNIGRRFGGRDHSTVLYAVRAVERRRAADPDLAARLDRLAAEIRAER